jgi:hypothetical protein
MIDATPGQRAYRISTSSPTRIYYREIEVKRVTKAQIICRTKLGQELRFWRKDGREVAHLGYASFLAYYSSALPRGGEKCVEAGCDRGKEWK